MACFVAPLPSSGETEMPAVENGGLVLISTTSILATGETAAINLLNNWKNHTDWWGIYGYGMSPSVQTPEAYAGLGIILFIGVNWDYLIDLVSKNRGWEIPGIGHQSGGSSGPIKIQYINSSPYQTIFGNTTASTYPYSIYAIKKKF